MVEKKYLTELELNKRHAEKMHKKKEARKKILATKTIEKGLITVSYTHLTLPTIYSV